MRRDVFDHLMELPVGYFDTRATGDVISRISYDIDTINGSMSHDEVQTVSYTHLHSQDRKQKCGSGADHAGIRGAAGSLHGIG